VRFGGLKSDQFHLLKTEAGEAAGAEAAGAEAEVEVESREERRVVVVARSRAW
jgi:hypothetical protein